MIPAREATDATTLGSVDSFSTRKMRRENKRRASSLAASVARLRRSEPRGARSMGVPIDEEIGGLARFHDGGVP